MVNGPKTWSLAAALHPEVAAAYDAAQERAATEIIGWLAEQWLVCHEGAPRSWWTSRGTEMVARLAFTEIVGTVAVPVGDRYDGPQVRLEGDDGSGYV